MGRAFSEIPEHLIAWMESQPLYFVATAPREDDGHVNLSPKGGDTFRVVDATEVCYLDLTGSGAETIAHIRQNGRLTMMFCSFGPKPNIVRLYGRGRVTLIGDDGWDTEAARFPTMPGARAVITLDIDRVSTSCGYSVPRMELVEHRRTLDDWAARKSSQDLDDYRALKNEVSIDGLPAIDVTSG